jgi:hypothetical protein
MYVFFLFPWCNNILLFNFIGVIGVAVAGGCVFVSLSFFSFLSFFFLFPHTIQLGPRGLALRFRPFRLIPLHMDWMRLEKIKKKIDLLGV